MLILSQDKTRIVNIDNIATIRAEKNYNESIHKEDCTFDVYYASGVSSIIQLLGKYKTEERAKEVLQLILENYDYITRALADMNGGKNRMFSCYFKMPKE